MTTRIGANKKRVLTIDLLLVFHDEERVIVNITEEFHIRSTDVLGDQLAALAGASRNVKTHSTLKGRRMVAQVSTEEMTLNE